MRITASSLLCITAAFAAASAGNPVTLAGRYYEERQETVNGSATATGTGTAASSSSASSSASSATSTAASSDSAPATFPTDIGYLGKGSAGQVPFLAETDRLNGSRGNSPYEYRFNATDATKEEFDLFKSLGNLSPYHSSRLFPETTANKKLPETCSVKKATIFHRHGARYPTSYATEGAPYFGAVLRNWTAAGNLTASGPLSFLTNWSYDLGAELLVPIGAQQLFDSGVYHYMQYGKLVNESLGQKPVVRTPSQSRMLNSSRYFTLGMFGFDAADKINLEVIIEGTGFNNTLAPYDTCNNSEIYVGDSYLRPTWDELYLANATERLQRYTNLNLTTDLVYGMQSLCAYESAGLGYSHFCGLFTEQEWRGFEYDLDLEFQGDYGSMSPTGRAQGIGYAQELLDFLSNSTFSGPVTTQNTTFDSDPAYYPVEQPLQISFTHDDVIVSVLTALNYTMFFDYLPADSMNASRTFVLSEIAPFAARLVHEVIECDESDGGDDGDDGDSSSSSSSSSTTYLRTLLNEAVVPMDEAQGCPRSRPDGLCPLDDFLRFQRERAVDAANFDFACFAANGTDFTITGPSVRNGTVERGHK